MPSFHISDSYQDPKPDPRQVHRGYQIYNSIIQMTFEIIEGGT